MLSKSEEGKHFPTKRSAMCLGVKAFFALPSKKSFLHPVLGEVGLHSSCHHTYLEKSRCEEGDDEEAQTKSVVSSPASKVVGRFQELKQLDAQIYDLCEYIDIVKGKHGRLLVVSEHYRSNLAKEITNYKNNNLIFEEPLLRRWAFRILRSLAYLNSKGIVHRNLSPETLLLDGKRDVKLADHGTYFMTNGGLNCNFAIGSPAYLAPETVAAGPCSSSSPQADVWSVGVVLVELVTLERAFRGEGRDSNLIFHESTALFGHKLDYTTHQTPGGGMKGSIVPPPYSFYTSSGGPGDGGGEREQLERRHESQLSDVLMGEGFMRVSRGLVDVIRECLVVLPSKRKTPFQLMYHPYFLEEWEELNKSIAWVPQIMSQSGFCYDENNELTTTALSSSSSSSPVSTIFPRRPPSVISPRPRMPSSTLTSPPSSPPSSPPPSPTQYDSPPPPPPPRSPSSPSPSSDLNSSPSTPAPPPRTPSSPTPKDPKLKRRKKKKRVREGGGTTEGGSESSGEGGGRGEGEGGAGAGGDPLDDKPLSEIFHFWKLAGGDLESELHLSLPPAILKMPMVVRNRKFLSHPDIFPRPGRGQWRDPSLIYDEEILSIPLTALRERLHMNHKRSLDSIFLRWEKDEVKQQRQPLPPLELREKDIDYQRYRVKIFRDLLRDFPKSRKEVFRQASLDIPPVLRGDVWAIVLDVDDNTCGSIYDSYDKESEGPADHQIDLDIPRCHQYNELLHSPEGHRKLRRVLKCWVACNPDLVYWQGLDSLAAPFVVHNFSNEGKAFCCMQAVVQKYLKNFFGKDNALFLQEHLVLFRQLLAYTDPQLAFHIHSVGFNPELFAIPWFLTLFTHVFPLHKIYHLWDKILLSPPSLPLFVAVSIMKYLRDKILQLDFNNCIMFMSNLPDIDIEEALRDSLATFEIVAPSLTKHKWTKEKDDGGDRFWDVRIPLGTLRDELAPRLSLADLINGKKLPFVIVDIRPRPQFDKEHIIDALSLPSPLPLPPPSSTPSSAPPPPNPFALIKQYRLKKHIVVVGEGGGEGEEGEGGGGGGEAMRVANCLVERHFPFVSVLHGGMAVVRADKPSLLVKGGGK